MALLLSVSIMKNSRSLIHWSVIVLFLFSCSQRQRTEEPAPPRPAHIDPNPSPGYLSPEESMKTMKLPPGYHMELVASEPQIQEPVAIVWDGNGRLYVAEMRSYMQDINGTGEKIPICRITRLEDTNGDGKMDKSTTYIDSLVLPRMMLALDDKLIVNETYSFNLYSYQDTNGDGIADEKVQVYHNDAPDESNLEHQKSGLIWNMDNWIYVTYNPVRYRYDNGKLTVDSI
jgi:glucose/arabinose dehydrogenase